MDTAKLHVAYAQAVAHVAMVAAAPSTSSFVRFCASACPSEALFGSVVCLQRNDTPEMDILRSGSALITSMY